MIKHIEYGLEWTDYPGWAADPDDPAESPTFDEAEARRRHDARRQYSMLIALDNGARVAVIVCNGRDCYFVEFLDEAERAVRRLCFEEVEPGRLFLSQYDEHAYEGGERRVLHGRAIRFKRDGRVLVMSGGQRKRHREDWFTVELAPAFHDEPVPAFGHWESLIRRRPLPYTLDSPS